MQVSVENVSELGRRMTVTVEDANIKETVQERLLAMQPTVKMAGFRPGKVPLKMVQKTHGGAARREVIDELVQNSMEEAFTQEEISPASPPHISAIDEKDNALIYTMDYDVFPEIDEVNLKDIEIEKTVAEIVDEDVERMLETLREQRKTWQPIESAAQKGHGVTVDFTGSIDGEPFAGGSGSDVLVVIGDGSMLPEFEEQLIGVTTGQNLTIKLSFSDDCRAEELRGKQALFDTTIKSVAEKILPELDEEFALLCGVEQGVAALRKEVRANMNRELTTALTSQNKAKVMDSLLTNNDLTLPDAPVEREAEFLMEQAKNNLANQGVDVAGIPFDIENFKDNAKRRVALSLLVAKIVTDNGITPEEARVKEIIDGIAASYEDPQEVVNHYLNDEQKLSQVQMMVVEDTVVDWICQQVKVIENKSSFSEVMDNAKAT